MPKITWLFAAICALQMPAAIAADPLSCNAQARAKALEFLNLDANGGRLHKWFGGSFVDRWQDEPGWDEITVIDGYDLTGCVCARKSCTIAVTYALSSSVVAQPATAKFAQQEIQQFELVSRVAGWRIKELSQPHVYRHIQAVNQPSPLQQ